MQESQEDLERGTVRDYGTTLFLDHAVFCAVSLDDAVTPSLELEPDADTWLSDAERHRRSVLGVNTRSCRRR